MEVVVSSAKNTLCYFYFYAKINKLFKMSKIVNSFYCERMSKALLDIHINRGTIFCKRGCTNRPKQKLRSYILSKYMEYLKTYESAIEKKFPAAVKLYRGFSIGIREFKTDLLCFFQVFRKVNISGETNLTRREHEVYFRMPKAMIKVAPVLGITALPFGGAIFPIAYMFPRALLSHHFWSLQQRSEFAMLEHKEKLNHYRPIFRSLQGQLRSIKTLPEHKPWSKTLGLLGSGVHPTTELILRCKPLFEGKPYHLSSLPSLHVSHLLRIHSLHRGWRRRIRLSERGKLLIRMDNSMRCEGGPSSLSLEDLKWACFFRGLNPVNVGHAEAVAWLENWLEISENVDEKSLSLLLHTPVLLGYNEPSNWLLLHDTRH